MTSAVVLVADDSPAGRASRASLASLVRGPLASWPLDGPLPGEQGSFDEASEIWIGPGAHRCAITRFAGAVRFRVSEACVRSGWGWYVSRRHPGAALRFLSSERIADALSGPPHRADAATFPFGLELLARAFHDFKALSSGRGARGAADWLAGLGAEELWPFEHLRRQELWEDWDRLHGTAFRQLRAALVWDPATQPERFNDVVGKSALGFFQEVCCKYLGWATGWLTENERARLMELSAAWR